MKIKIGLLYFICLFSIPFSFLSLTGCDTEDLLNIPDPATIEFSSPANGMVFPFGTTVVTIYGRIIPGDNDVVSLKAETDSGFTDVAYDSETFEFSYDFTLDQTKHYSICTLKVTDSEGYTNMNRICYAIGDSAVLGDPAAGDDAIGISMTEDLLNDLVEVVETPINYFLPYVIDEVLPINQTIINGSSLLGSLVIDPDYDPVLLETNNYIGKVEIGHIDIGEIDCLSGNRISVGLTIEDLLVQGYHEDALGIIRTNFRVESTMASVSGVIISLSIDENDMIAATVDFSDLNITLKNTELQYGLITIPDWLIQGVVEIVVPILKRLELKISDLPIMDANLLTLEIANMNFSLWPMDDNNFFTTTDDSLTVELGIGMTLDNFYESALYPEADSFLVTDGDMPNIAAVPGENDLMMAVSDEVINQGAFTLVQSGLLEDIDLSKAASISLGTDIYLNLDPIRINLSNIAALIPSGNTGMKMKVSVTTPPVADFSGDGIVYSGTEPFGTFIVPNIVIEIENITLSSAYDPLTIRMSIDATAAIGLDIEGNVIKGSGAIDMSEFDVNVLYFSAPGATDLMNTLMDMGLTIAQMITGEMIGAVVELEIPENDLFTMPEEVIFNGNTFENNYLVVRLNMNF